EVASGVDLMTGRAYLHKVLEGVFGRNQHPGSIHRFLANCPAPVLIVTTNYDTLIEQAFCEQGRKFHVIMTPIIREHDRGCVLWWAPSAKEPQVCKAVDFVPIPEDLPVIYKIHGGIDPTGEWYDSVITEDDYFEIGGRIYDSSLLPFAVQAKLQHSPLLFL